MFTGACAVMCSPDMARKLTLFSKYVLEEISNAELIRLASNIRTLDISETLVWNVWAEEIESRAYLLRHSEQLEVMNIFTFLGRDTRQIDIHFEKMSASPRMKAPGAETEVLTPVTSTQDDVGTNSMT
eukprot:GHVT01017231.1.p1 GENE.GHVT01017231.1~~GHVT01017231.1.p1  ORF type:complete len:128 (+),score=2.90 GHVT01017231.1:49-432(+)